MMILLKMSRSTALPPPLRGPRWGYALRIYVQAHRSGIFKRNLNVYTAHAQTQ